MVQSLGELDDVEVLAASTLREATSILERDRPDLVISDLDLPDGSAVEIMGTADRCKLQVPIVFLCHSVGEVRWQIPDRDNIELREKPLSLSELCALAKRHLARNVLTRAELLPLFVSSCSSGRSVKLAFGLPASPFGEIEIQSGQAWSARDRHGEGNSALRRLLFETEAHVSCGPLPWSSEARNLDSSWQDILLEAAEMAEPATEKTNIDSHQDTGRWEKVYSHFRAVSRELRNQAADDLSVLSPEPDAELHEGNTRHWQRRSRRV